MVRPSGDPPACGTHRTLHPGNRLKDGRYEIVRRLGRGATSTVWLAHDESSKRLVSIKILASEASKGCHEPDIRRLLAQAAPSHPGSQHVQQMLDAFLERGWFDNYQCMVGTPGAASLSSSKVASRGVDLFPLEVSRAMAAQLILAVGFLHSQGVVHGDIYPGNILVALSSPLAIDAYVTFSTSWWIPTRASALDALGDLIDIPSHKMTLSDARILLTDFGDSWLPEAEDRRALRTPYLTRSPEVFFARHAQEAPLSAATDIWALACAVFYIYGRGTLFEFITSGSTMAAMEEAASALGPPPAKWLEIWTAAGHPSLTTHTPASLKERADWIREEREEGARFFGADELVIGDDELADIAGLLESMIRWDPGERSSASELVEGHWMARWGRPAMARVEDAGKERIVSSNS